jgi:hypothetical protein
MSDAAGFPFCSSAASLLLDQHDAAILLPINAGNCELDKVEYKA